MSRPRPLPVLGIAWGLLLIPSIPLFGHTCYGFIGFLAHTPLYAFYGVSALLMVMAMAWLARRTTAVRTGDAWSSTDRLHWPWSIGAAATTFRRLHGHCRRRIDRYERSGPSGGGRADRR